MSTCGWRSWSAYSTRWVLRPMTLVRQLNVVQLPPGMLEGCRDSVQYSALLLNRSHGVAAYRGSSTSMMRFTTSLRVNAVNRLYRSMRLMRDKAPSVATVLYRIGNT